MGRLQGSNDRHVVWFMHGRWEACGKGLRVQLLAVQSNGGAIFLNLGSSAELSSCTLVQNLAQNGGAIFLSRSSVELNFCTLSGNHAKQACYHQSSCL